MAEDNKADGACFEFKGSRLMVMVLHLYDAGRTRLSEELRQCVEQAPNLFKDAPVMLDLNGLLYSKPPQSFKFLVELLEELGMHPVGVRGGNRRLQRLALTAGLGILPEIPQERKHRHEPEPPAPVVEEAAPEPIPEPAPPSAWVEPKVVMQPVRSGQQVVAHGDLVILSTVSPGAEVLAEGSIHVYGALRGRALAGIKGAEGARIFCQNLEAELVSVAGHYQISEELPPDLHGKPTQVYLQDEKLTIAGFGR